MFHIVFNLVWISQNIQYFMRLNFMKQKWKLEIAYLFLLNGMHHDTSLLEMPHILSYLPFLLWTTTSSFCVSESKHLERKPHQYWAVTLFRYHQVTSVGSNIAVNIWWKHLQSFIPSKCDNMPSGATLNQFHFSSLSKNGDDDSEDAEPETLM